jgi:hypothetical protein
VVNAVHGQYGLPVDSAAGKTVYGVPAELDTYFPFQISSVDVRWARDGPGRRLVRRGSRSLRLSFASSDSITLCVVGWGVPDPLSTSCSAAPSIVPNT